MWYHTTSKPGGTIHVKKDGAASGKTPATSTTPNRPTPRAAYRGAPSSTAAPPSPEAKHLFDEERLPDSSSKAGRKRPQVEIHTQGRPPSVETERPEQKPPKRGRDPEAEASRKAAKAHAAALPPAGERPMLEVAPATCLEVVPHDAVAELTDGSLPDENTIASGTSVPLMQCTLAMTRGYIAWWTLPSWPTNSCPQCNVPAPHPIWVAAEKSHISAVPAPF
ncbi:hypothetical protein B0H14DRAFT_2638743 [Mycena olivaceomarginata]|nr:hypothetical protein B0H14DRAFT_2638743 [Mycena olivaceomarginata]